MKGAGAVFAAYLIVVFGGLAYFTLMGLLQR
jgi:hypothetical protein